MVGTALAHYEIEALLGEGGMGRVYRARDTRLGRAVAIKILPDALRADPDRVTRFGREAKLLAALNHPHIAALYGLDEAAGRHFLVMELVDGDTLADRLGRGPLLVDEALRIALEIAEALEEAHEKGIVHRDLKPANIKLTAAGAVKVLDFGLAKAMETDAAATNLTASPTLSLAATQAGVVLGTAAYMSPEQAKGLPADHRSDIFSFGVVLLEMLTGRQPFEGETAAEIMASVIVRENDLSTLPPSITPRLPALLKRCLEKHPRKRWQAIGDVRAELETIAAAPMVDRPLTLAAKSWRRILIPTASAIGAAAVTWTLASSRVPPAAAPLVMRFDLPLAPEQSFTNPGRSLVAMAPDGSKVAYIANSKLWLRSMSELEAKPIAGTESLTTGITSPVFSPDGEFVAFWGNGQLQRVAVAGGTVVAIASIPNPFGLDWHTSGLVVGQGAGGIVRMSPNGGSPERLVTLAEGELADSPQVLPGGEWVLFTLARGSDIDRWDRGETTVQSLGSGERRKLLDGAAGARYVPTGHLVYAVGDALFAVRFDLDGLVTRGGPIRLIEPVARSGGGITAAAHWSASDSGSLVYLPGSFAARPVAGVGLLERSGQLKLLPLPRHVYSHPRRSPDGTRFAASILEEDAENIWTYELNASRALTRLTFGGRSRYPVWTSDGERIAFQTDREGDMGIFWQRADTPGGAERLTRPAAGEIHIPHAFSPDGSTLLFSSGVKQVYTLQAFSMRDRKVSSVGGIKSDYQLGAVFSPNGQWIAYHSNQTESRADTVFVEPFPPTGARYQIGTGVNPWWSADGRELFFAGGASAPLIAVRVEGDRDFRVGGSQTIARPGVAGSSPGAGRQFDNGPSGSFLVLSRRDAEAPAPSSLSVVLNWFEELKARLPD